MKSYLVLENGEIFDGERIGYNADVIFEVVFNTSMTGYLEIFTDPSYSGQGVVMTYPLIGNYGLTLEDKESAKPWVKAVFVHELAEVESNFRSKLHIDKFLKYNKIPGLQGVNTRKLTKVLRDNGTMRGMLTDDISNIEEIIEKIIISITHLNPLVNFILENILIVLVIKSKNESTITFILFLLFLSILSTSVILSLIRSSIEHSNILHICTILSVSGYVLLLSHFDTLCLDTPNFSASSS